MSETKFTPGPWRKSFTSVDCGRGRYINQIWWKHKDVAEAEANAALIAAAPELYHLLKMATEEACSACAMMMVDPASYDFIENGCPFADQNELCEYRDCIAILRKARGESEVKNDYPC